MADNKVHLASLQDVAAAGADLSTPRSVESIVKKLTKKTERRSSGGSLFWAILLKYERKLRDW